MAGADSAKLLSKVEYYNRAFTVKYLVKKQSFMEGNVTGNKSGFSTTRVKEGVFGTLRANKASQAIQSPRTVPFFLLVSLLDGYSFPNVLVKGIVAFKH